MTPDDDHDGLAAEYVLGTLDAFEREQVEALMATDPAFSALVRGWERRLGELNALVPSVEPPPETWEKIKAQIAGPAQASSRRIPGPGRLLGDAGRGQTGRRRDHHAVAPGQALAGARRGDECARRLPGRCWWRRARFRPASCRRHCAQPRLPRPPAGLLRCCSAMPIRRRSC